MNPCENELSPPSIEENDSSRLVLIVDDEPQLRSKEDDDINRDSTLNRKGFIAKKVILSDVEEIDHKIHDKILEEICQHFDSPMSSRTSEVLKHLSSDFPPSYERAVSDTSETNPKQFHYTVGPTSSSLSNSAVKTIYSSDSSDNDEDDLDGVDKQALLREIELLKKQQEEMKKLQESHDKRLKELLDREPCVHRRLESIRKSIKPNRGITAFNARKEFAINQQGKMIFTQEHIYVQLEQLYENLHRLNFPTKTIQSVLGNDWEDSYSEISTVSEITSLRDENIRLKKKVTQLEMTLRAKKPSWLPKKSPPPPCVPAVRKTNLGQIQAKSETGLNEICTKFIPGRPTSPPPLLMTPKEIHPVEITFKWTISDYSRKLEKEKLYGGKECSSPFYLTHCGYKGQLEAYLNGNGTAKNKSISVFLRIIKGDYDRFLKWPVNLHLVVILVNQTANHQDSLKADGSQFQYVKPWGTSDIETDSWGLIEFVDHKLIQQRKYIRDDKVVLKCRMMILPME
ncbi:hypothetical protein Btru_075184 [Bulinus truncatus]|nr:hypothetical protein Btru_075184 [Bulinus truncatus]